MEKLSKSLEKYISVIYELANQGLKVTPRLVGEKLGFNKASTSEGLKLLEKKGLIDYYPYKKLLLTELGENYAKSIEKKQKIVEEFLKKFLLLEENSLKEATKSIEYGACDMLLDRMNSFLEFLEFCPNNAPKWINDFKNYLETGEMGENCSKCFEDSLINGECKECKF